MSSILNDDGTPTAVYTSEQSLFDYTSYPGDIVYTLPNITSGVYHTVRLYFFYNGFFPTQGEVLFDVYINDTPKLLAFDLIGEAGGPGTGLWREFPDITAQNGAITVRIVPEPAWNWEWGTYYYNATISGIKVAAQ